MLKNMFTGNVKYGIQRSQTPARSVKGAGWAGIMAEGIWLFSSTGVSSSAAVLAGGTMDPLTSLFTEHSKST